MEKYFFMRPFLNLLAQGRFFHRALAITLRVLAAMIVLFSLTTFFQAGKLIFELPTNGILGGVLFELFFILAVYCAVHVLLIRASDIEGLDSGDLYALRAAPLLLKLAGELYASFVSLLAIGVGIFVWFTNLSHTKVLSPLLRELFPTMRDKPDFMGGIEFLLTGVLISIAVLVVSYTLSELISALLRLTRDTSHASNGRPSTDHPAYKSRFGS